MNRRQFHAFPLIVLTLALSAPLAWGDNQGSCSLAGTWYGGGNEAKYLGLILPAPGNDFISIFQGAFSQSTLGFPVQTIWTGTISKNRNSFESFAIGMVNESAAFPAPVPQVWGVHARVRLIDCDTLRWEYDFFGAYLWNSNKLPFIDKPDYVVVPPPFTETYRRMPTRCPQCDKN